MQSIEDYETLQTLHESANSLVLRARAEDGSTAILKILKKDYPSPIELTRYRQEYEITRSIDCEHVIAALGLVKHDNTLMMTLEDFGGESVARIMQGRRLTIPEVLQIAKQTTMALRELHDRHIVHKDINPSNVVFNPGTGQLKLIDFGIATRLSRENPVLRSPEVLEGTLAYMSPEQTGRTSRSMDYRTDFYSLGAALYHMATHHLPFETNDPVELVHSQMAKQVVPAHERSSEVPVVLSRIIDKLLAKAAEERYQSAYGILADLELCERVLAGEEVGEFEPGRHDDSDHFSIPQRLYGREDEVRQVLSTFHRVSEGPSELMLIAGYSGVGKSALIQEVYEPITARRGYFASGKFDQLQRNVPFSAIVRALQDLVRQLLTEGEAQLEEWRWRLQDALGPNGQVIADVIPDVELIVGPQEPVPELGSAEANNRFNLVFSAFIRVFCGNGRPLVLFLDDLQWADSATLRLIELLMTDGETENLLLIGAYRDNEVDAMHPLTGAIERLREQGVRVGTLELAPLGLADVTQLVADTLRRSPAEVERLATLVVSKTGGNPFFLGQFLQTLYQQGLITREVPPGGGAARWRWDIDRIEAADITDNVVELMIAKVRGLPEPTQQALRVAACIGSLFDLETLALTHGQDPVETFEALVPALEEGLILPTSELEAIDRADVMSALVIRHFRFLHDRVQQSAYALFEGDEQKSVHLEIGRRLLAGFSAKRLSETVFEVVDHLDQGRALITDPEERHRLAELNLVAGKRAKEATAYSASLVYLQVAREMMGADPWTEHYELAVELHMALVEVEYLNGNFEASEQLVKVTLDEVRSDLERAEVYALLVIQYTLRTMFVEAIAAGQKQLALLGIELPLDDLDQVAGRLLGEVGQRMGDRDVASLYDAPDVVEPRVQMAQLALRHLTIAAFLSNQQLFPVITALSVELSLEHGNAPESALSYSNYGLIIGAFMGMYERGAALGELGLRLCDKFHPKAPTATVCLVVGSELIPWVEHVARSLPVLDRGYQEGLEVGEILWGGYLVMYKVSHETFMGKNLEVLLGSVAEALDFARRTNNQGAANGILAHRLVISNLAGATSDRSVFASDDLDEAAFLALVEEHQSLMALCLFCVLKSQALFLYGEHEEALRHTRRVDDKLSYIVNHVQLSDHRMVQALALIEAMDGYDDAERAAAREQVEANLGMLEGWARCAPANYAHKHALVQAELARIDGDDAAAIEGYERAIASARDNEYVQDRALASERAARYWLARNRKGRIGQMYLRDARHAYELWGAKRKVELLDEEFPEILVESVGGLRATATTTAATTTTRMTGSDRIDLASVLKATQAISGEIGLGDLLRKLVRIVVENAGAQRGVIVLDREGEWLVEAVAEVDEADVSVMQGVRLEECAQLSVSMVKYVIHSKSTVVLHDATRQGRFTADPYVVESRPKSVLCMPLLQQGRVSGVLYLENNLSEGTFTADRLGVLRTLAAQAAISIQNATLYASLEAYNQTLEQKVEERTRDILRTQDQLVAQEKMAWMGTLSVGIAHEIKNPLNFINNFAELSADLASELVEEIGQEAKGSSIDFGEVGELVADITRNMEKIRHHGRRADGIVESMMVLAEGRATDVAEVDVNRQVEELASVVHHGRVAQGDAEVQFVKEYDEGLGTQAVIPQGLSRVLVNLLNNAYDALEERRRAEPGHVPVVTLRTVDDGDSFEITVCDNGTGIAAEHLAHVREPFFTTKPAGSGHIGLGLSVSNDIVTLQHHGELRVRTEPGSFTEMTIRLPKDLGSR